MDHMTEVREYLDAQGNSPYAKWFDRLNVAAAVMMCTPNKGHSNLLYLEKGVVTMNEHYTEEFRQEAVRLAITGKTCKADVARDLGVKCSTLHTWIRKYRTEILSSEPIKLNFEEQNKQRSFTIEWE